MWQAVTTLSQTRSRATLNSTIEDKQVRDITLFNSLQDSSLKIEQKPLPVSELKSLSLVIQVLPLPDPLVPVSTRRKIFDHFHSISHPGRKATSKMISERFVWPNMNSDIKIWTQCCVICQRVLKTHRHTKSLPGNFPTPDGRFRHLHVDLVGPLPEVHEHQYILTIIDRFSRWPVATPHEKLDLIFRTSISYNNRSRPTIPVHTF